MKTLKKVFFCGSIVTLLTISAHADNFKIDDVVQALGNDTYMIYRDGEAPFQMVVRDSDVITDGDSNSTMDRIPHWLLNMKYRPYYRTYKAEQFRGRKKVYRWIGLGDIYDRGRFRDESKSYVWRCAMGAHGVVNEFGECVVRTFLRTYTVKKYYAATDSYDMKMSISERLFVLPWSGIGTTNNYSIDSN